MGPFLPTSLKIRKNTPYYAMVAILSNHGSSQKLVKMPQTLRVDRGAWIVHESSVEILIFRLVRNYSQLEKSKSKNVSNKAKTPPQPPTPGGRKKFKKKKKRFKKSKDPPPTPPPRGEKKI